MCGIVGGIAHRNVAAILIEGLKRLEYRGYDSAGIAVISNEGVLQCIRKQGKVKELADALDKNFLPGSIGIAHTRWATHGEPVEHNAHPHISHEKIAIVHNGIIENYEYLKQSLLEKGYQFNSETDTEVVAHLIYDYLQQDDNFPQAVRKTIAQLEGAYALAIINRDDPTRIIVVRRGSPLVIGFGIDEMFIASDHLALLPVSQRFIYLEEGDIAEVTIDGVTIIDAAGNDVDRLIHNSEMNVDMVEKGSFRHYMQKEIFEQGTVVQATLEGRLGKSRVLEQAFGESAPAIFEKVKQVQIVACGTSYHAGLVARYWLEEYANIPCNVEVASEIRYRKTVVRDGTLFVSISQSGETADTLAALKQAKQLNYLATLAICNVAESSLVRGSDLIFMTRAGIEIGVASTKAFTTQLTSLLMLTCVLGRYNGMSAETEKHIVEQLRQLPRLIDEAVALDETIQDLAQSFADKQHALFLGRGSLYPVALEGALKLKEISYIHAEAYPAGELKHGPLALIDKDMPVVTVAPNDELLEKLKSNLHEVRARGGELIVFADAATQMHNGPGVLITDVPTVDKSIAPIIYTIPLQLLAYHVAVLKGTDVDQPRNLAKSVTVE